jgi:hypothetical protein
MAGSLAPVMYWAVRTTLYCALWSDAEQLPYQAVMQPVRMLSMTETEQMGWHETPGNHMFDPFDTIPLIPHQSFPRARSHQLRCHQLPVVITLHITQSKVLLFNSICSSNGDAGES